MAPLQLSVPAQDAPLADEPICPRPAPVTYSMREREDISRADASAARCFIDQDARILAAAFDCLHLLAKAEIDLAFGRLAPFRMPGGR